MNTQRMGLVSIPQDEWNLYPQLVLEDEAIPNKVKSTFILLHARAGDTRSLTISAKQAVRITSCHSAKTFSTHLSILRKFCLIGTSKTQYGTYIEFYSPWLRYTRIRQKQGAYSVEPNSWIHPRIAQFMHIAGKFPSDLKKLTKEYQTVKAVEKAMEALAWENIHKDLANTGYSYVPDKKSPGVYSLVMYSNSEMRLRHDNSFFPKFHGKDVMIYSAKTGKKTKMHFERSFFEMAAVDPDLKEAVETRDSFDTQAYALGYRMCESNIMTKLQTYAVDLVPAIFAGMDKEVLQNWYENEKANAEVAYDNTMDTEMNTEKGTDTVPADFAGFCTSKPEKRRVYSSINNTNSSNDSSLYIFHKEINSGSIRYASLRSCTPEGGNCKEQNKEEKREATEEAIMSHDISITHDVYNNNRLINTNITEIEETDTETEQNDTTISQDPLTYNVNVTETERNFTETTEEGNDSAFPASIPSNTDKVVGDSWLDCFETAVDYISDDEEDLKQNKLEQKQKRADRKARKSFRDALARTDIKIPNLTSAEEQDRMIADVCSQGLATDPDKILPAWTVKHPAARWEAYQAEQNRVETADKDVSWISNIATARKNASRKLTEPLESLSWRSTLSSTHKDPERSLNASKRFWARYRLKNDVDPRTKKHYPACYQDQK
jgi:hypothetical protein